MTNLKLNNTKTWWPLNSTYPKLDDLKTWWFQNLTTPKLDDSKNKGQGRANDDFYTFFSWATTQFTGKRLTKCVSLKVIGFAIVRRWFDYHLQRLTATNWNDLMPNKMTSLNMPEFFSVPYSLTKNYFWKKKLPIKILHIAKWCF